jgi:hypothetical protein
MPILGTTSGSSVTSILAGDIVTMCQRDMAGLIGDNNPALLDYVNRVQLELLRLSRWRFLLSEPKQFTTVSGAGSYQLTSETPAVGVVDSTLALTDLDIIKANSVINRTTGYSLYPSGGQPVNLYFTNSNYPTEWVLHSTGQLDLWPKPNGAYVIEFQYYATRPSVTAAGDTLVIPIQYKDIVAAGVNYLTSMYLAKDNPQLRGDAAYWKGLYDDGKRQMVRDANLFPRVDYMSPDATSQRSAQTTVSIETSLP